MFHIIFYISANGRHDPQIVHNTVVGAGMACMRTTSWSGQTEQYIANNAFYCEGGTAMDINGGAPAATITNNVVRGSGGVGSTLGVSAAADLGASYYPPAGSALINAGSSTYATDDDFNATERTDTMADVGAYEVTTATNPGWTLAEDFKSIVLPVQPDMPPVTGGDDFTPPSETQPGGCCSSTTRPSSSWLALLVLGLLVRRRR